MLRRLFCGNRYLYVRSVLALMVHRSLSERLRCFLTNLSSFPESTYEYVYSPKRSRPFDRSSKVMAGLMISE